MATRCTFCEIKDSACFISPYRETIKSYCAHFDKLSPLFISEQIMKQRRVPSLILVGGGAEWVPLIQSRSTWQPTVALISGSCERTIGSSVGVWQLGYSQHGNVVDSCKNICKINLICVCLSRLRSNWCGHCTFCSLSMTTWDFITVWL